MGAGVAARSFTVGPTVARSVIAEIERVNCVRAAWGEPRLTVRAETLVEQVGDPLYVRVAERITVTGTGPHRLDLGVVGAGDGPELMVNTGELLAVAAAAVRIQNGRFLPVGGETSTVGSVRTSLADSPDGVMRQVLAPTPADRDLAARVREWIRGPHPGGGAFYAAARAAVAGEWMSLRSVDVAVSAFAPYLAATTAQESAIPPGTGGMRTGVPGIPVSTPSSLWFGQVGEELTIRAEVTHVEGFVTHEGYEGCLYLLRTPDGDLVRWVAWGDHATLDVGDVVDLRGRVRAHSHLDGEKQTEMYYCSSRVLGHTPVGGA